MAKRRITKQISVGGVLIGGRDNPVVVQSMTTGDTRDIKGTIAEIKTLEDEGCEIIRVAVPDKEAADAIPDIMGGIGIPLIADIHFHYELALASIKSGVDGERPSVNLSSLSAVSSSDFATSVLTRISAD